MLSDLQSPIPGSQLRFSSALLLRHQTDTLCHLGIRLRLSANGLVGVFRAFGWRQLPFIVRLQKLFDGILCVDIGGGVDDGRAIRSWI